MELDEIIYLLKSYTYPSKDISNGEIGEQDDAAAAPSGGGGGVFARLQGLRNDVGRCFCIGHQAVDQRAFARSRGAKHQGDAVGKFMV